MNPKFPPGKNVPRFSIVVPAYNAETTLAETLSAVESQTLGDWECIVVDDGSTDGTGEVAAGWAGRDPRFRVLRQENKGSAGAYNAGVGAATGEFVVLCSADDILLPEHLSSMNQFINQYPQYDIYASNGYFWREDDSRQIVYAPGEMKSSMTLADVIRNCFYSVGATYRTGLFAQVGGYRLGVFGEDYDFWMRAMAAGAKHQYVDKPLSLHRVSATQKSANLEKAYRSDIRLVTDLLQSGSLSEVEVAAVHETVRARERAIGRLNDGAVAAAGRRAAVNARSGIRTALSSLKRHRPTGE